MTLEPSDVIPRVDHYKVKYPYCIVWTSIPILTYLCPIVGHVGIGNSEGEISEFVGGINLDKLSFGGPMKFVKLKCDNMDPQFYNDAIAEANSTYSSKRHNIIATNCYDHVCQCLNNMQYNNSSWGRFRLTILLLVYAKYVNKKAIVLIWFPFIFIVLAFVLMFFLL